MNTRKSVFQTLDDLRTIIFAYGEFRTATEVGLGDRVCGLVPESFGLIHEYYTPTAIADAMAPALCPMLPELAGNDGVVRALEPSAGIGRLLRAFSPQRCLAIEAGGNLKKLGLVVSNPPYGERGELAREDEPPHGLRAHRVAPPLKGKPRNVR